MENYSIKTLTQFIIERQAEFPMQPENFPAYFTI